MKTANIELYTILTELGVDKKRAESAVEQIANKDELAKHVTESSQKVSLTELKLDIYKFMFVALVTQTVFIVGLIEFVFK